MKKSMMILGIAFISYAVHAQNVGIGTASPSARLHVVSAGANTAIFNGPNQMFLTLQENGVNRGYIGSFAGIAEDIDFGTYSSNPLGSLHLTTGNQPRLSILPSGFVGINTTTPKSMLTIKNGGTLYNTTPADGRHALALWDSSFGLASTAMVMGAQNTYAVGYITVENIGSTGIPDQPKLVLQVHGDPVVIGGNPSNGTLPYKLVVRNGNAQFENDIFVQYNKGLIRSADATQQKKQTKIVSVVDNFAAGQTRTYGFSWSETFSASHDAFVGSIAPGSSGGWAEVIMTVVADTNTGGTLFVYNPKSTSVIVSFNVKMIGIGPQ
jgi:hypothetical protein